jgi:hypothetical protein
MSTGNFENWAGTITDIGPMYPFVGTEMLWFILGLVFWIGWHIIQAKRETRDYAEEVKRFGDPASLRKVVDGETPENP